MKQIDKLFNTQMHPDLMQLVDLKFRQACQGYSDQFLFNIDDYLRAVPGAFKHYYNVGVRFLQYGLNDLKWKTKKDFSTLDDMYIAILGVSLCCVYLLINVEEDGFPISLHVNKVNFLKHGIENALFGVEDENKLVKSLMAKTLKGVEEGKNTSVRLDLDSVIGGRPFFKLVIPRSRVDIGLGKQMVLIPLPFMYHVEGILFELMGENIFKFVKDTVKGKIDHVATLSDNTVRKLYTGCEDNLVENKISKTRVGYDLFQLRFLCYDVESSLSSIGTASFRPEMLDAIKLVDENDIDKSQYNIDYDMLRGVFKTQVSRFTTDNFNNFNIFDTSGFANNKDRAEAIINWGSVMSGKDLYNLMKMHSKFFGDVDQRLETRNRVSPKIVKMLKAVDLPEDVSQKAVQIKAMLNTGLVKMVMISKNNRVYERVCSNNIKVLKRMLGKDYIINFESVGVKIKHIRNMLVQGKIRSRDDMENILAKYNVLGYMDREKIFANTKELIVGELDRALNDLNEKAKPRSESMILYRNVYAGSDKDFFGLVNVNNILNVEFVFVGEQ